MTLRLNMSQHGSLTDNEVGDTRHEEKLEEERPE